MDPSVLIGPIVTGIITALISGISVYVVMSNRMAILETKMDHVCGQLEQQNRFFDRIHEVEKKAETIEREQATYWKRYDELKERVERVEGKVL